eukprot:3322695-Rhodomonas_salina.1
MITRAGPPGPHRDGLRPEALRVAPSPPSLSLSSRGTGSSRPGLGGLPWHCGSLSHGTVLSLRPVAQLAART